MFGETSLAFRGFAADDTCRRRRRREVFDFWRRPRVSSQRSATMSGMHRDATRRLGRPLPSPVRHSKRPRVFQSRDRKRQIPRGFEYRFLLSSPPRGFIRQGGQVEYEISLHGIDIMVPSDEKEPTTMDMEASTVEKSLGRGRKTAIVDGLRFCSRPTNVRKTMGPGRAHSSRLHAVARCVARQLRARSALSSPDEGGVCANTFSDRMDIEVGARHNVAVSENVIPRATFRGIVRSRNSFMVLRHRAETHRWSIDGRRDSRDRNERRRESVRATASSSGGRRLRRRADESSPLEMRRFLADVRGDA